MPKLIDAQNMALRLGGAAVLASAVVVAFDQWRHPLPHLGWLLGSVWLPAVLSWLVFVNTLRSFKRSNIAFMNAVVGGLVVKLLVSLIWIGLVAWLIDVPRVQLGFAYLVPFIIYMTLEVHGLLNNLQAEKSSDSAS